jgi:hypothetical protein
MSRRLRGSFWPLQTQWLSSLLSSKMILAKSVATSWSELTECRGHFERVLELAAEEENLEGLNNWR